MEGRYRCHLVLPLLALFLARAFSGLAQCELELMKPHKAAEPLAEERRWDSKYI